MLFWNERDLAEKLTQFTDYYNRRRFNSSLNGCTPAVLTVPEKNEVIDIRNYRWQSHCGCLCQTPIAA